MPDSNTCPRCGANLSPDEFGGLCPACMIGGINVDTDSVVVGEPTEAPTPEELNHALPEFDVIEIIGRGGMGTVYLARQFDLDRFVAIKLMSRADSDAHPETFAERFAREAKVTAKLDHPAIVPVYNIGYDAKGRSFYTMRLVRGRDFAEIIALVEKGHQSWNLTRALGVLVRICQVIAYAHAKGVIHRDIKPPNVMVGELGEVYMLDWGVAKFADSEDLDDIRQQLTTHHEMDAAVVKLAPYTTAAARTLEGSVIGTPAYMSPEQAAGRVDEIDHLADIYSLGAILYHLLARHPPYMPTGSATTPFKVLSDVLDHPPEKLPELRADAARELIAICDKAMARERPARYATALGLAEDIQAYLDNRVVRAYESGGFASLRKWVKRNRAFAAAALVTLICLIGGLATIAIVQTAAKREVGAALDNERLANQQSQLNLADAYTRAGLAAADDGHLARSQLWFSIAADTATHDPHRLAANRMRAKTHGSLAPIPIRVVDALPPIDYNQIIPHPTLPYALLEDWNDSRWRAVDFENEQSLKFGGDGWFSAAAFDPNSDHIAVSHAPGKVEIRSLADHDLIETIDLGSAVNSLAFSPDGKHLFIGAKEARIWDSSSRQLRPELLLHDAAPDWAVFSGDGKFLLTSTQDPSDPNVNTVRAFSIDRGSTSITPVLGGSVLHRTRGSIKYRPAFVGPNGERILSFPKEPDVVIWETLTGKKLQEFRADSTQQVTPDGRLMIAGRHLHNLETGTFIPIDSHGHAAISPDQSTIVSDHSQHFLSTHDGRRTEREPPQRIIYNWEFVEWSGASCLIGTSSGEQNTTAVLWRLPEDPRAWSLPVDGPHSRAAFSADGRHVAPTGHSVYINARDHDGPILTTRVYDLATGQPASAEITPGAPITDVAFSPDGETLALALGDPADKNWDSDRDQPLPNRAGRIEFWDWKRGERLESKTIAMRSEPHRIAYHPDGWLAAMCASGDVVRTDINRTLFQIEKGKALKRDFSGDHSQLYFDDAGKYLVAGLLWIPTKFYVWDVQSAALRFSASGEYQSNVGGDVLQVGGYGGKDHPFLYNLADGTPFDTRGIEQLRAGNLSADGEFLLTAGFAKRVEVWDWRNKKRAGFDLGEGGWHTGSFLENTPWVVTVSTGSAAHSGSIVRLWDWRSGLPVAPPIKLEPLKLPGIALSPSSAFGVVTSSDAPICLDLSSLLSSDWPSGKLTAPDLLEVAELHAFETFENGQLRSLETEEWVARWKKFRTRHPDFHQIAHDDPAGQARYHRRRAQELNRLGNAFGAAWHLERIGKEE